ncbi:MAG TPA: hypothetical protein VK728_07590 [Candidatus Sulfotelmatobacter sp.]|nr:hypothetical protein [Candidatus Sulfotelmatobacter sp.]
MSRNWVLAVLIGGSLFGGAIWYRRKKRRDSAWSIDNSLEEVAQAHAEYLRARHPAFHQKFANLLIADREAALGEAAVFSLLKTYFRVRPEPADVPGTGGVDFVCHKGSPEEFVVEVTSLKPEAVAAQSKIPTTIEDGTGGPFQMTTDQLFSTVRSKADQLSGYPCPRILAITSTHHASSFLLGPTGAEFLLTSEPTITYAPAGSGGPVTMTTTLKRSVFFGPGATGTQILPRRQSVSAVLLIGLDDVRSSVLGLLHPEPARKLSIERFRDVPFLRLAEWPIIAGAIRTEWVISSPESKLFPHAPIRA